MMAEEDDDQEFVQPRPFWSGILAFGLVSLPVSLFPANRGKTYRMQMVAEDGTPLARRYFCAAEDKPLERDDLVRGYEIEKGRYVIVEDEELEALAPEKSREIDLKRFVSLADINPVYFERVYFLVPDGGTNKAYRLLAKSMEDEQRAGIATFVMRDREYLVAIIAERGILRAETLRFHDEVRSPADVGLPALHEADADTVKTMQAAMQALARDQLDTDLLSDRQAATLRQHVEEKLAAGRDVLAPPEEEAEVVPESNVIDLMQVLKARLAGKTPHPRQQPQETAPRKTPAGASQHPPADKDDLEECTREELYERAKELHIPGRSQMTKRQLLKALRRH